MAVHEGEQLGEKRQVVCGDIDKVRADIAKLEMSLDHHCPNSSRKEIEALLDEARRVLTFSSLVVGYTVLPPAPVSGPTEVWMSPGEESKGRVNVKQRASPSAVTKADEKVEDVKKDRKERLASLRRTESVESVDWATKYVVFKSLARV